MSLTDLLLFALTLGIASATPGPTTTALVARVLARGAMDAPMLCLGLLVGDLVWLLAAALGIGLLAEQMQPLLRGIQYAGVAYLLYLAWKFWTAPPLAPADGGDGTRDRGKLLLTGLSIGLGNPKTMLFYLALLPGLLNLARLTVTDLLLLAMTLTLVYVAVLAAYVALAQHARGFIRSPRALRRVNRGSAVLMAGAAVAIGLR